MFVTQNEEAKKNYNDYQNGVFAGRVVCIPLGTDDNTVFIQKREARLKLGLPPEGLILLSFGAPHSGKDIETVIKAAMHIPEVFVVHAGTQAFSLGSNPKNFTEEHNLGNRTAIFDHYIGQTEERLQLFAAADALVLSYTKVFKSTSSMLWEAAKYRLPVISSNANLLGAMVREYNLGLLFEAENTESLVDAIRRFEGLGIEELELMRLGCQKFVKDYSDEKWAKDTIGVCEQLVKSEE